MKVLIFKPSKHWDYCGGALVVSANSVAQAHQLVDNYERGYQSDTRLYRHLPQEIDEHSIKNVGAWVLHATLNCPDISKGKIILWDWNYA